jgi:hypothetical protein
MPQLTASESVTRDVHILNRGGQRETCQPMARTFGQVGRFNSTAYHHPTVAQDQPTHRNLFHHLLTVTITVLTIWTSSLSLSTMLKRRVETVQKTLHAFLIQELDGRELSALRSGRFTPSRLCCPLDRRRWCPIADLNAMCHVKMSNRHVHKRPHVLDLGTIRIRAVSFTFRKLVSARRASGITFK